MRGHDVPSFYNYMQPIEKINKVIEEALATRGDLFVVDSVISTNLDIHLTIDGDKLVNISDCIDMSRKIEHNLDREEFDFSIKIQSPGADEPLLLPRQYHKHIGRVIKLKTNEGKFEGKLENLDDDSITLVWKTREKKPIGKGKVTVKHEKQIPFKDIVKANIKLTFNTK